MLKNKVMVLTLMLCIMLGISACRASSSKVSTAGLSDTMWGTFKASDGSVISLEATYESKDGTQVNAMIIRSECSWLEEYVFVSLNDDTIQFLGTDSAAYNYTYKKYVLILEDIESGDSKTYTKISDDYTKEDILDVSSLEADDISGLYTGFTSNNKWIYIIDNGDKTVDVYYLLRDTAYDPVGVEKLAEDVSVEDFGANQEVVMRDPYIESDLGAYFSNSVFLVTTADDGNFVKADDSSEDAIETTEMVMEVIDDYNAARNGEKYISLYKPILDGCQSETQYALADINNNGIAELILLGSGGLLEEGAVRVYQIKQNSDEAFDKGTEYFSGTVTFYTVGGTVVAETSDNFKLLSLDSAFFSAEILEEYELDDSATVIEFSSSDDLSLLYSWSSESETAESNVDEAANSDTDEDSDENVDEDNTDDSSGDAETTWDCDERYLGTWQDSVSQRCTMTITQGAEQYCIEINWSESADAGYRWIFFGSLDDEGIYYSDGICMYVDYSSGASESTTVWSEGDGEIYFVSDIYLCWDDYVEGAGDDCLFEKVE